MSRFTLTPFALASLVMCGAAAWAAPADDLIASARLWQAKNQPEMARLAVAKALRADPTHAEALLMQAQFDLKAGDRQLLQRHQEMLQRYHPGSSEWRQLQAQLRLEQGEGRLFSGAQSMARAGRVDEAVAMARRVFPDGPPGGDLSLQYYQILSASSSTWQEATNGLQRLVAESPRDPRYQLALGRHLIQREATRVRGVQLLARLSAQRSGDVPATRAAWRQGLLALTPGASSLASVDAYLAVEPGDVVMRRWRIDLAQQAEQEVVQERERNDPAVQRRNQLLAALDSDKETVATEQGLMALATERPRDADVLGGLGRLRMRQGRHDEAVDFFTRAAALDAGARGKWLDLAGTARFWGTLKQLRAAREAGDTAQAMQHAEAALRLKPGQPDAMSLKADLQVQLGQDDKAEATWRAALAASPGHEASLEGLATLLTREGRLAEAERLLPATGAGRLQAGIDRVRASQLRHEADDLVAAGQHEDAISCGPPSGLTRTIPGCVTTWFVSCSRRGCRVRRTAWRHRWSPPAAPRMAAMPMPCMRPARIARPRGWPRSMACLSRSARMAWRACASACCWSSRWLVWACRQPGSRLPRWRMPSSCQPETLT
ncbi:MAG: tetratricopeptide repeat protein [Perlucidibaca sp.]